MDLAQGHPHPPGYPALLALGALARAVTGWSPARALSLVSALSFALTAAVIVRLVARRAQDRGAMALALIAWCASTLAAVQSARPLSDMLGCALAWCVAAVCVEGGSLTLAAVLFGCLCGARLSVVPFALPAVLLRAEGWGARARALSIAGAVALTLHAPLVLREGVGDFIARVVGHAGGHFTRYGGSIGTQPDVGARALALAHGLWAHALGGWWRDRGWWLIPWSLAALWALGRGLREKGDRTLAVCAGVYLAWAFLGQNVRWQPRHLLPLAPFLALGIARGMTGRARAAVALCGLVACGESVRLMRAQRDVPPPTLALARWADAHLDPRGDVLATGQLATWLRWRAPRQRVIEVDRAREAVAVARSHGLALYVTSELDGAGALPGRVVARAAQDRYVTTTLYDLALRRVYW